MHVYVYMFVCSECVYDCNSAYTYVTHVCMCVCLLVCTRVCACVFVLITPSNKKMKMVGYDF